MKRNLIHKYLQIIQKYQIVKQNVNTELRIEYFKA